MRGESRRVLSFVYPSQFRYLTLSASSDSFSAVIVNELWPRLSSGVKTIFQQRENIGWSVKFFRALAPDVIGASIKKINMPDKFYLIFPFLLECKGISCPLFALQNRKTGYGADFQVEALKILDRDNKDRIVATCRSVLFDRVMS